MQYGNLFTGSFMSLATCQVQWLGGQDTELWTERKAQASKPLQISRNFIFNHFPYLLSLSQGGTGTCAVVGRCASVPHTKNEI